VHQADAPWLPTGAEVQDLLSDGSIGPIDEDTVPRTSEGESLVAAKR